MTVLDCFPPTAQLVEVTSVETSMTPTEQLHEALNGANVALASQIVSQHFQDGTTPDYWRFTDAKTTQMLNVLPVNLAPLAGLLVSRGAAVETGLNPGGTFNQAVANGQTDFVAACLPYLSMKDVPDKTALVETALMNSQVEITRMLLEHGFKLPPAAHVFQRAMANLNLDMLTVILENTKERFGSQDDLLEMVTTNQVAIASLLLRECELQVNELVKVRHMKGRRRFTPTRSVLGIAVNIKSPEMVKELIENNADPFQAFSDKHMPLSLSAQQSSLDTAFALITSQPIIQRIVSIRSHEKSLLSGTGTRRLSSKGKRTKTLTNSKKRASTTKVTIRPRRRRYSTKP